MDGKGQTNRPASYAMKTLASQSFADATDHHPAVALAAVGGIYALIHYQKESDFKPLFTGVAPEDAAAIVQKLRESGIDYRLPDSGGTVLVPSAQLAELRLTWPRRGCRRPGASVSSCSTRPTWAPPNSPNTSTTGARSKANWSARSCRWRRWSRRACT